MLVMTEIEALLEKALSALNTEVHQYRQQIATTLASSLKIAAEYCHSDYESLQEAELLARMFEFAISDMAKIECLNQKLAYVLEIVKHHRACPAQESSKLLAVHEVS